MQLGQQLGSLKLQQSFVKELNQDDIDFAERQYKKIYAEEMSKISSKIQRIERVKRNLQDIQSEETNKLKEKKQTLNKKYQFIEKNKQKHMTQKLKSCKIYHEVWEHKISTIKRKTREYMKLNAGQSQKLNEDVQKFWKTKTEEIHLHNKKDPQQKQRNLSLNRNLIKKTGLNLLTQNKQKSALFLSNNYQQKNNPEPENTQLKNKFHHNIKTIRFLTQNLKQSKTNSHKEKTKNESNFTQKFSIQSLHDLKQNNTETKHSIKIPHLNQNLFSQKLSSNLKIKTTYDIRFQSKAPIDNTCSFKLNIRNELLAQQSNFSFQKAMKKLDKIHKLKQKSIKKQQPSQNTLSPSRPRKPIDADQYRLLRVKSEVKKSDNKLHHSEQNVQVKQTLLPPKDKFTGSRIVRNHTLGTESRQYQAKNISNSRLSMTQSRIRQEEKKTKQRQIVIDSERKRWKKDKIIKAIKDKIFRIKLSQMQKINEKQVL